VSLPAVLRSLRVVVCLLALATPAWVPATVHAAQPPADDSQPLTDDELDDFFGFDDEEVAEPTFADLAQQQAPDILAFTAFGVLAMVSFWRRSERLKYVTLVVCVLYMGFYKSYLISVVNVFGMLSNTLPPFDISLAWYAVAVFTVVTTLLWGRLYCGRICGFGAFTQLLDAVVPRRFQIEVPKTLERRAGYIKFVILFGAVGYYLVTRDLLFYRYIEPFWMYGAILAPQVVNLELWIMLGVLLVASIFVRNLYCRFLCPLGAFLGLISSVTTVFRIKRWSECGTCRICEKTCEWGAIRGPQIIRTECVRCDDCERLYANEVKCPHHRIIAYKAKLMTRQEAEAAAGTPALAD